MEVVGFGFFVLLILGLQIIPLTFAARIISAIFNRKSWEQVRTRKLFHVFWAVGAVLCVLLFLGMSVPGHGSGPRLQMQNLGEQIRTAILSYETEYGVPPPAKDNAGLVRELAGHGAQSPDNPRGIVYLTLRPRDMNSKGEVLNPWGTPVRIIMTDPKNPIIQSAGPDRIWGTKDDINCTTL